MKPLLKKIKYLPLIPLVIVTMLILIITVRMLRDKRIPYDVSTEGVEIPTFTAQDLPFTHEFDGSISLPIQGGAVFELDGEAPEEIFIGGGVEQPDAIFRFKGGAFKEITAETGISKEGDEPTLSAVAFDADGNGTDDLLVTRTTGIWLYLNENGKLTAKKLMGKPDEITTPASVAITDINRDGHFDMFVCGYIDVEKMEGQNIFNKEGYGGTSRMYLNKGDNTFEDITESSGLTYKHNTFQAMFADIDRDGLLDLVVAHDTGQIRTWKNLGGNKFKNLPNPSSEVYGYPMGIAVSDVDNDGELDWFFSNVGTTAPKFIAKGDLREGQVFHSDWYFWRGGKNFRFKDAADDAKLADYEFSWGAAFDDFNLDGRADLVVSENYIAFPPHKISAFLLPGRFLIQNKEGEFAEVGEQAGVKNPRYSIAPLTADFNGDGYPDLVHVNLGGKPQVFLSKGGDANYVRIKLKNTVASVGTIVTAELSDGRQIVRPFVVGEGLCSDSSHIITIGSGKATVSKLMVTYLDGETQEAVNPPNRSVHLFTERKPK